MEKEEGRDQLKEVIRKTFRRDEPFNCYDLSIKKTI